MPVKIRFNAFAIDVYSSSGGHVGAITRSRMESRDAPYMVAEALACILGGLGHHVTVAENKPQPVKADASLAHGAPWKLRDGRTLTLLVPDDLTRLPKGTILHTIDGLRAVVGQDVIDGDTYDGNLAYGIMKD